MSLVTYDSYVQLVFGLMKMDKANKERSKAFVQSIVDGSSTNLCGGLIKGMYIHVLTCSMQCVSPTHAAAVHVQYTYIVNCISRCIGRLSELSHR